VIVDFTAFVPINRLARKSVILSSSYVGMHVAGIRKNRRYPSGWRFFVKPEGRTMAYQLFAVEIVDSLANR
jgi:hypothetical protein